MKSREKERTIYGKFFNKWQKGDSQQAKGKWYISALKENGQEKYFRYGSKQSINYSRKLALYLYK